MYAYLLVLGWLSRIHMDNCWIVLWRAARLIDQLIRFGLSVRIYVEETMEDRLC